MKNYAKDHYTAIFTSPNCGKLLYIRLNRKKRYKQHFYYIIITVGKLRWNNVIIVRNYMKWNKYISRYQSCHNYLARLQIPFAIDGIIADKKFQKTEAIPFRTCCLRLTS